MEKSVIFVAAPPRMLAALSQNSELLETMGTRGNFISNLTEKLLTQKPLLVVFIPEDPHEGFDAERWEQFACSQINNPRAIFITERAICSNSSSMTAISMNYAVYETMRAEHFKAEFVTGAIRFLQCKNDPDCDMCNLRME